MIDEVKTEEGANPKPKGKPEEGANPMNPNIIIEILDEDEDEA